MNDSFKYVCFIIKAVIYIVFITSTSMSSIVVPPLKQMSLTKYINCTGCVAGAYPIRCTAHIIA